VPLVLVLSVLPDVDIILGFLLNSEIHRGPTHSIVTAILVFVPFFVLYRQKVTPYFAALVSHSLIGDFFIGGQLQLLWPLSTSEFGLHESGFQYIDISSPLNLALEVTLFAISLIIMYKTRDLFHFFRNNQLNLVLIIPIFTVLLPTFIGYPLTVPAVLVLPHLFYLVLFSASVLIVIVRFLNRQNGA